MDFSRLSAEKKAFLVKRYFFIGCACAPLVWVVNAIFFFNDAFKKEGSGPQQKTLQKYVILSIIGSLLWTVVIVAWQVMFQVERAKGLRWTDAITFVYPSGYV
uniref:Gamma-secretase subunit PEN-2 n=1 Tax=Syphacia muris TaxID=451379 RepID=A0A0N5AD24_9BILA